LDDRRPTKSDVRDYLTHLLVEVAKIPPTQVVDGACLNAALKVESVAFIEIQVALEERFDIEIDLVEVLERNEFQAIVDYLYEAIRRRTP